MSLFPEFEVSPASPPSGLRYQPDFLTPLDEATLIAWIDSQPWETELSRRRQFYGGSYDSDTPETVPLPAPLDELAERLIADGLLRERPDRCLINEYLPGQGIAAHVDYHPRFGDEVTMISLLDEYPMRFAELGGPGEFDIWLARRSVCVITGPARYDWTHEIVKRLTDPIPGGGRRPRKRRVSITFRRSMASGDPNYTESQR